ncbi:MAG TPA: hypothetical protein VMS00_07610 [Acidimicrobiales bacterium]|nr:hypothetical protein [Acidimicrobiales bacterium]
MAKARPRRSSGAPADGASGRTANRRGKAQTNDAPANAIESPELLDRDENVAYQPQGSRDQEPEPDLGEHGYAQPGVAGIPSQWPSVGAAGWDGNGTGGWDAATDWGPDGPGEAWEEQDGWDGGLEAWEPDGGADEAERWAEPDWSEPGYERGYAAPYLRSRGEAVAAYQDYGTLERDTGWTRDVRRRPRPQQSRGTGPWPELVMITAVAVIIAAVILAVTSADRSTTTGPQAAPPTLPAVTAQRTHSSAPATGKYSKSTSPPSTSNVTRHRSTPTTSKAAKAKAAIPGAKNLAIRPGVPQSLVKSWLATNPGGVDLRPKDVAGTVVGELYYAEQPASATYWATVVFKPSARLLTTASTAAGETKLAQFQNSVYVFSWKAGPVWTLLGEVSAGSCPDSWVPRSVLKVWGLCGL